MSKVEFENKLQKAYNNFLNSDVRSQTEANTLLNLVFYGAMKKYISEEYVEEIIDFVY